MIRQKFGVSNLFIGLPILVPVEKMGFLLIASRFAIPPNWGHPFLVSLRNWGQFFREPLRNFFFRVQSPFHDVVAAPDRPVGIVIVWRGLRAPYCTNTMLSMHSLRVRSFPVSARLSW